jgi:ribose transport system ATP-binding protein
MSEGRITGTLEASEATPETVMHYATLRPDENPEDAAELGLDVDEWTKEEGDR